MALRDRLVNAARELLGVSSYSVPATNLWRQSVVDLDDPNVKKIREALGGNLQMLPTTVTRWYLEDLETCQSLADTGDMSRIGQLCRTFRRDGLIGGLMSTRTSGLVALPKRFRGHQPAVDALTSDNGSRALFDEMFPPSECALMAEDGIGCGVAVAELLPVVGRDYPVMVRLAPEFLRYRWNAGMWFYQSVAGMLPIYPGDGRWILHTPGGRVTPWQSGHWMALGRAYINKEHALLHRSNYSAKLANPARYAKSPPGSTEDQRVGFLASLIAWGINTVFELPAGWDVGLLESNGRGWEVFGKEVDTSDLETMITLAGQVVTVTGGTGFSNADIHKTIRADLIKQTGDALAYTLNTQGIAPWQAQTYGVATLNDLARVSWDTAPPEDQKAEADTLTAVGAAIEALRRVLAEDGKTLDVDAIAQRFGLPIRVGVAPEVQVNVREEETASAVTVDEVREAQGLPPIGDERGDETLTEVADSGEESAAPSAPADGAVGSDGDDEA